MIKGIQKTTVVDYPGKVACTLFTGGCNFRCKFCHNSDLVLRASEVPDIEETEILDWLEKKTKYLDGVCITGGEPTLHKELIDLIKKIKEKGFLVKLDTNGTNPEMLGTLIKDRLVDYVAMDIKSSLENYEKTANSSVDISKIKESIKLLMKTSVEHEFRTTIVPSIINEEEIKKIGKLLSGAKKFYIQQFIPSENIIDPLFRNGKETSPEEMEKYKQILLKSIDKVEIRNMG